MKMKINKAILPLFLILLTRGNGLQAACKFTLTNNASPYAIIITHNYQDNKQTLLSLPVGNSAPVEFESDRETLSLLGIYTPPNEKNKKANVTALLTIDKTSVNTICESSLTHNLSIEVDPTTLLSAEKN